MKTIKTIFFLLISIYASAQSATAPIKPAYIRTHYVEALSTDANLVLKGNGTGLVEISDAYTLPAVDGDPGQVLMFNGDGTTSAETLEAGGDVFGPSSAQDNYIARFNGTTGKLIQNSGLYISDVGASGTDQVNLYYPQSHKLNIGGGSAIIELPGLTHSSYSDGVRVSAKLRATSFQTGFINSGVPSTPSIALGPSVDTQGSNPEDGIVMWATDNDTDTVEMKVMNEFGLVTQLTGQASFPLGIDVGGHEVIRSDGTIVDMISVVEITVTSSEILNSFTTPIVLIPAPGPGMFINLIAFSFSIDFNSVAYSGGNPTIRFNGTTQNVVPNTTSFRDFVNSSADSAHKNGPALFSTPILNSALEFLSTGANPTSGDSDIKVKIWYSIESI